MANAEKRAKAARAYVKSLKTGEMSAAARVAPHLASDVVLSTGQAEFKGHAAVLQRVSGQWPNTPIYLQGGWGDPQTEGEQIKVHADFPPLGGGLAGINLTFSFNDQDQINRVEQALVPGPRPEPTDTIPDFVRGIVDTALANGTPMTVAYTDESGQPVLSMRGSTVVFNDHQLGIWIRNATGGIIKGIETNPKLGLLYRDSRNRTTLIFQGRGHVATDEATRNRLYEMTSEVEQNHDPDRKGAALIIDVTRLQGNTVRGAIRVERPT
jgi:hypothetical protein